MRGGCAIKALARFDARRAAPRSHMDCVIVAAAPRATAKPLDDTPAKLLSRYGRHNLEEVFLDVARGRGIEHEAAQ